MGTSSSVRRSGYGQAVVGFFLTLLLVFGIGCSRSKETSATTAFPLEVESGAVANAREQIMKWQSTGVFRRELSPAGIEVLANQIARIDPVQKAVERGEMTEDDEAEEFQKLDELLRELAGVTLAELLEPREQVR